MRGTIAGKRDVIVDAAPEVNPAVQPAFEINQSGSHTLQSRDFEDTQDATGEADRGDRPGHRRRQWSPSIEIPALALIPHRYWAFGRSPHVRPAFAGEPARPGPRWPTNPAHEAAASERCSTRALARCAERAPGGP